MTSQRLKWPTISDTLQVREFLTSVQGVTKVSETVSSRGSEEVNSQDLLRSFHRYMAAMMSSKGDGVYNNSVEKVGEIASVCGYVRDLLITQYRVQYVAGEAISHFIQHCLPKRLEPDLNNLAPNGTNYQFAKECCQLLLAVHNAIAYYRLQK